jgi:hypothetical protein
VSTACDVLGVMVLAVIVLISMACIIYTFGCVCIINSQARIAAMDERKEAATVGTANLNPIAGENIFGSE